MFSASRRPPNDADGQCAAGYYVHLILAARITDLRSALSHIEAEVARRATDTEYDYTANDLDALRNVPLCEWKP
jgi:hypothetical protein